MYFLHEIRIMMEHYYTNKIVDLRECTLLQNNVGQDCELCPELKHASVKSLASREHETLCLIWNH